MLNLLKAFRPIVGDFLSTILFIVVLEITDNVVLSTSMGIATGIVQFLWLRYRGTRIELMQWASLVLVIVLGGATILTKDARFMMIKPSIAGFAIACVMLTPGWQSRYMPSIVKENLSPSFLLGWGYVWSALYFALAAGNLVVAFGYSRHVWEAYTAVIPTALPIGLFVVQYVNLRWLVRRTLRMKMTPAAAE